MVKILMYLPVLIASIIVGRWFLSEVAKSKKNGAPWYAPYFSIPGIMILIGLTLPIVAWLFFK